MMLLGDWWVGYVLLCLVGGGAADAAPWEGQAFSTDPKALLKVATAQPAPKDTDVEVLLDETAYRFDGQGRQQRTHRWIYRCLTQQGVDDWSSTEVGWAPWHEQRPTIRARVITPDGVAHPLDLKSIAEVPVEQYSPDVLSDQRRLRAPLPAVTVGAVVEVETVVGETQPLFSRGTVEYVPLVRFWPVRKLRVSIDHPASLPLRYKVRGVGLTPVRTERDGHVTLLFQLGPVAKTKHLELYLPADQTSYGQVIFTTGKSWAEVAAEYAKMVEGQLDQEAVKSLVQETLAGQTDRQKVVASLLAKLHQLVRYTGVEFGQAAIVPHAPRETLVRRYGDCKDQATLLVAMLRAAGLPAHVALLNAGTHSDVVPDMPGLGRFNHAIVYVPGETPLWIDPTARYVPVGQLPVGDQGRWALIASSQTKDLVQTPRAKPGENRSLIVREYTLSQWGKARVREKMTATGAIDDDLRSSHAGGNDKELRQNWRAYAEELYHSRALESLMYSSPQDFSKPFEIVAEIKDAEVGQVADTEALVSLWPKTLFARLPMLFTAVRHKGAMDDEDDEAAPPRKSPLVLPETCVREVRYRITPPAGFAPRPLPEKKEQRFGPATIRQEFQRDGNTVVASFQFDTGNGRFSAEEVEGLRRGIAELGVEGDVSRWQVNIGFDHVGAQHLAAGRMKEALVEYRRLVELEPKRAEPRSQYAQALVEAGLGDAARQEARRAVELAPDSAAAHYHLARILTYDLAGRHFRPGMDWDGAATAYRKSLELKPSDPLVRWDYAILLSRGRLGEPYAVDAKLEESIAEYRKAREQVGSSKASVDVEQLDVNLALALLHAKRYAEMEENVGKLRASPIRDPLLVTVTAIQKGATAAEQKAAELARTPEERRLLLAKAGDYLQGARLYPHALKMYEAVPPGMPNQAQFDVVKEAIRQTRRIDEVEYPKDDPRHVVQRFWYVAASEECGPHRLAEYCVKTASERDIAMVADDLRRVFAAARDRARQADFSLARIADAISVSKMVSEGDATVGYRVFAGPPKPGELWLCVVREQEAYRVLPSGPEGANLGAEALRRLAAGEANGARRWLDWAWDSHKLRLGWFNAFSSTPFAQIWQAATRDDPKAIRLASAALVAEGRQPAEAIPILLDARKETTSTRLQLQIDRALARAYWHADRLQDMLEVVERILGEHRQVQEAVDLKVTALWALGRWDEARLLLESQLADKRNNPGRAEVLAARAATIGEFRLADRVLRRLADEQKAFALGLNELAWNALFQRPVSERAIKDAIDANGLALQRDSACLHTLAALYAESGRTAEALATLHRSIDVRMGTLDDRDWYVLGRIAEQYGLRDVAVALYRKVPKPKRPAANDVFVLAKGRLEELAK